MVAMFIGVVVSVSGVHPAQAQDTGAQAAEVEEGRASSVMINPLGALFFPELRVLIERRITQTSSFALGGAIGGRYFLWSEAGGYSPFIVYEGRDRLARVHGQLRKYLVGHFLSGLYLSGELNAGVRQTRGFLVSPESVVTPGPFYTIEAQSLLFGGAKTMTDSGFTVDVSLGGGLGVSGSFPTLVLTTRLEVGWSF